MTTEVRSESTGGPPLIDADRYQTVQNSADFIGLRRALLAFVVPATIGFLAWYLLYVLLSAYARDFMGTKLVGNINVALVFGLLQFVSTFGIAIMYSRYASRHLDPVAEKIRAELESPQTGAGR
jgi:uncharacterized membrane protein (DUF485 family)